MSEIESIKEGLNIPSGLSLAAGIIILFAGTTMGIWHVAFFPQIGWMNYCCMPWGFGIGTLIIGIVSGVIVILSAIMMSQKPHESYKWGVIVLIFSLLSLFGMGGFMVGAVLGIIGGILALTKH